MARRTFASIESTADQAETYVAQGRWADAAQSYRDLIGQTHVVDYEYDDWLRKLTEVYKHLNRGRSVGFISLYLHYFDQARTAFAGDQAQADLPLRARLLEIEKRWSDAASAYTEAGMPVHAAVCLEKASAWPEAASAWGALTNHAGLRGKDYELALAHFNYGSATARLDASSVVARRALIESQRRLEQVADDFETKGELERAFDCFQILLKLGKDSGTFENLAEGYVNCIRVLREDNLKFYVLQYYEDFIKLALERGELHAAATLYQEAADYALRVGLPYDRRYQSKAAETWVRCAEKYVESGVPVEMAENALMAAASQYSVVGDFMGARTVFDKLAKLDLGERAQARFDAIARRLAATPSDEGEAPAFPDYLRQQHAYADIWFVDLLEWELGGDPYAVAASIVGELRYPNGIRRRALMLLLTLAEAAEKGQSDTVETLVEVAELLGGLQFYAALSPLERLYAHKDPQVRRAAVRALRFLYFKRAFVIVRKALADTDPQVREAALVAISGLHFPHAFNPLTRIFRESTDPRVKAAALESIGKIQTVEAGEFVISVLRQEEGDLRNAARAVLVSFDNADIVPILRQHQEVEANPVVRDVLGEVLRRVG